MRKSSWALVCAAALAEGIYESSFIGSAPGIFSYFRPMLPISVMLFLLNRRPAAYAAAIISGLAIDLLSASGAGWHLARYLLVMLAVDVIAVRITTNRSLYSAMALVVLARLTDRIIWQFLTWAYLFLSRQALKAVEWSSLPLTLGFDMLVAAIIFIGVTVFTKRFVISVAARKERYE